VAVRAETLARLDGPGAALERLVFTDESTAPCQSLFCFAPTRQRSDLAARLGCRLLDDGKVEVNQFGQTTRAGVYAVGDMARTAAKPIWRTAGRDGRGWPTVCRRRRRSADLASGRRGQR
jgi:thioredoxin reductase